jgi:hypothetical protein
MQALRYSGAIQSLMDELIGGSITYRCLFRSLILKSPSIVFQVFRTRAKIRQQLRQDDPVQA